MNRRSFFGKAAGGFACAALPLGPSVLEQARAIIAREMPKALRAELYGKSVMERILPVKEVREVA